jgi:hypothetical protein
MKTYWTTRDGKRLDIDEMSIEHLRNCLKTIVRAVESNNIIKNKFKLKGDMANMYNDDEQLADLQAEYDLNEIRYDYEAEDYGCR